MTALSHCPAMSKNMRLTRRFSCSKCGESTWEGHGGAPFDKRD